MPTAIHPHGPKAIVNQNEFQRAIDKPLNYLKNLFLTHWSNPTLCRGASRIFLLLKAAAQGFAVRRIFCTSQPETRGERSSAKKNHLGMETNYLPARPRLQLPGLVDRPTTT